MPKPTDKKATIIASKEEVEDIISDVESEHEDDSNDDVDEVEVKDNDKKKTKLSVEDMFIDINKQLTLLDEAETEFLEKEKEFEKDKKEHVIYRKKIMRLVNGYYKQIEKEHKALAGKKKKPRKTENAGKGGFNKLADVPQILRNYIGIDDEQMSRPQVTKLLNQKFSESGLMKTKKDDNGKEIKVIILDKTAAKKLKLTEGHEIRNRDIQTFIAKFYKEDKEINA